MKISMLIFFLLPICAIGQTADVAKMHSFFLKKNHAFQFLDYSKKINSLHDLITFEKGNKGPLLIYRQFENKYFLGLIHNYFSLDQFKDSLVVNQDNYLTIVCPEDNKVFLFINLMNENKSLDDNIDSTDLIMPDQTIPIFVFDLSHRYLKKLTFYPLPSLKSPTVDYIKKTGSKYYNAKIISTKSVYSDSLFGKGLAGILPAIKSVLQKAGIPNHKTKWQTRPDPGLNYFIRKLIN